MMKKLILMIFMVSSFNNVFATTTDNSNIADLEQLMKNIDKQDSKTTVPDLPTITENNFLFNEVKVQNIFSDNMLKSNLEKTNDLDNYDIRQLQMVGVLKKDNIYYAFLKTPYETLLVKQGSMVKSSIVVAVSPEQTELEDVLQDKNSTYRKKVFIKLETGDTSQVMKLQLNTENK